MVDTKSERPNCFGILENVFPKTKEGLRMTPESCFPCFYKTDCLKQAMAGLDGLKIQDENIDRAYEYGMISFLERWSRKKMIRQKMQTKHKKMD